MTVYHCFSLFSLFSLRKTGKLVFGSASKVNAYYDSIHDKKKVSCVLMTSKETNEKYSKQLKLPDDFVCVFEDDAGLLKADVALAALQVIQ